ncbi:MAG: CHRD domain-containing protein [Bacteroidota bacterium]
MTSLLYVSRLKYALSALILALVSINLSFAQTEYRALLSGRSQVMPVLSAASGSINASLEGNQLTISGQFQDLSSPIVEDGMNIHIGMAGQEGAVTLGLIPNMDNTQTRGELDPNLNTFTINDNQAALLEARELYISVATINHPDGEIRGQIVGDALTYFSANLFGSNEVPTVTTFGSGQLIIELVSPNEVVITGSFNNLGSDYDASIGSHLHTGNVGINGPVLMGLTPQVSEDGRSGVFRAEDNTITIDINQLIAIGERRVYANVHTLDHPGGEVRGQFAPAEASAVFRAHLTGSQAVPVQTSLAEGVIMAETYSDTLMIIAGSFDNLESAVQTNTSSSRPGLYAGAAGTVGGFLQSLNVESTVDGTAGNINATDNVLLLSPTEAEELFNRNTYINLGTDNRPSGALRGQLVPEAQIVMHAFLSGTLAVPTSASRGQGSVIAELSGNMLTLSGGFGELSGSVGRPSLRNAHVGNVGAQLFALNRVENTIPANENAFELNEDQIEDLLARQLYINVPSSAQSSGELRGQLLPEATAYFVASLSGASQVAPVNTAAYGQAILEYRSTAATVTGSFSGLDSDFNINAAGGSHIYDGFAGTAGEIVQRLNVNLTSDNRGGVIEAADNMFNLTSAADLFNRGEYINIVTTDEVNGAIRGQLLPFAQSYFTTSISGQNTLPLPTETEAVGGLKAELIGDELIVTGSIQNLPAVSDDMSVQLLLGGAGMEGDEIQTLNFSETADPQIIELLPAQNRFRLSETEMRALRQDRLYVDLTTDEAAEGLVRGQLLAEPNYFPQGETVIDIPTNGERVINEGDPTGRFRVEWTPAEDESDLYYIVESSEFEDFRAFDQRGTIAGFDSTFLYSVAAMDSLLAARGFEVGDEEQRYYRLTASDGSLQTGGAPSLLTFRRGEVQSVSGADLELTITAPTTPYEVFMEVPYQIMLVNNGPQNARNIFVDAQIPEGMVFTSANPTEGDYNVFFGWWNIENLNAGDTAVLNLTLFTLIEEGPISMYAQVIGGQPADPDSVPNNGTFGTPNEDDEAEFTIFSEEVIRGGVVSDLSLTMEVLEDEYTVFSNTTYILTLTNDGPDSVANVRVSALIPDGMVFSSATSMPEGSSYRIVTQDWEVPFLRSGESATLELVLFSLVEGEALTLFAQVIASDQEDPDSTPANDLDGVPDEDDEAAVTIIPGSGLDGGEEADLSLSLTINDMEYQQFTDYVYTFTLTNDGPDDAANVFIDAQLPDSLRYTTQAASTGEWNLFFQYWYVPFIASGETQTLRLTLFTLSAETPITFFAQIIDSEQDDPDSTPNNNDTGIPEEDDEVSLTITPTVGNANQIEERGQVFGSIYPVPTTDLLNVNINADRDHEAILYLIDFSGRTLQTQQVDLGVGDNLYQIQVDNYPAGTYYLYLRDQQGQLLNWQFIKL